MYLQAPSSNIFNKAFAALRPLVPVTFCRMLVSLVVGLVTACILFYLSYVTSNASLARVEEIRVHKEVIRLSDHLKSVQDKGSAFRPWEVIQTFQDTHSGIRVYILSTAGTVLGRIRETKPSPPFFVRKNTIQEALARSDAKPTFGVDPEDNEKIVPIYVIPFTVQSTLKYLYIVNDGVANGSFLSWVLSGTPVSLYMIFLIAASFAGLSTLAFVAARRIKSLNIAVSGIAHDIRSPLTAIQNRLEMLVSSPAIAANEPLRAAASLILKDTDALGRMASDLHELTLMESRSIPISREPLPIHELLMDATQSLSQRAADRQITLVCDIQQVVPRVEGDMALLDRLIRNLIENSLRYTPAGGKVFIHLYHFEGQVRTIVSDTGVGIGPKDLIRAGSRFWRSERTAREIKGTGLGLHIARRIAALHGSELRIVSTLGDGTAVIFDLPVSWRDR